MRTLGIGRASQIVTAGPWTCRHQSRRVSRKRDALSVGDAEVERDGVRRHRPSNEFGSFRPNQAADHAVTATSNQSTLRNGPKELKVSMNRTGPAAVASPFPMCHSRSPSGPAQFANMESPSAPNRTDSKEWCGRAPPASIVVAEPQRRALFLARGDIPNRYGAIPVAAAIHRPSGLKATLWFMRKLAAFNVWR